jgi:ribonuclease E
MAGASASMPIQNITQSFGNTVAPVASNEVNILRLGPDKNPAPPVSRNASRLSAAFDKGYTDVRDHMELRDFLKSFVGSGG